MTITGIASFGSPLSGTGQGNAGFDFKQNITQVIDNFTYIRAAHSYKFGIDMQGIHDERIAAPQFLYTFPSIAAYHAAKDGTNPSRLLVDDADHRRPELRDGHEHLQHCSSRTTGRSRRP